MKQAVKKGVKTVVETCSPYYSLDEEGLAVISIPKKLTLFQHIRNTWQFITNAMKFGSRGIGIKTQKPKVMAKSSYSKILSIGGEQLRQLEEMKRLQSELIEEYGESHGSGELDGSSDDSIAAEFSDADGNFDFSKFLNAALSNSLDSSEESEFHQHNELTDADTETFEIFNDSDENDLTDHAEFESSDDNDSEIIEEALFSKRDNDKLNESSDSQNSISTQDTDTQSVFEPNDFNLSDAFSDFLKGSKEQENNLKWQQSSAYIKNNQIHESNDAEDDTAEGSGEEDLNSRQGTFISN